MIWSGFFACQNLKFMLKPQLLTEGYPVSSNPWPFELLMLDSGSILGTCFMSIAKFLPTRERESPLINLLLSMAVGNVYPSERERSFIKLAS